MVFFTLVLPSGRDTDELSEEMGGQKEGEGEGGEKIIMDPWDALVKLNPYPLFFFSLASSAL